MSDTPGAPASAPESQRFGGSSRWAITITLAFGMLFIAALIGIPLAASLRYRSAVHDLHDEMAAWTPSTAEVIDEEVDACYQNQAAASVRVLQPVDGVTVEDVRLDYIATLTGHGFESFRSGADLAYGRERDDDLDADTVHINVDESANTITIVADAFDIDSVTCLPFG